MSSPRFERAVELWRELRGLESGEQARALEPACAADPHLLELVQDMLLGGRNPLRGLDEPFVRMLEHESIPERIGNYRILGPIEGGDRGGMGVVYLAEQESPRRQVALKVLRRELDDERSRQLFRKEVDILGGLRHPGIARVYEGDFDRGPTGDLPFFVMELVTGKPLDEWADSRRLDTRARVSLLVKVCDAVAYAHETPKERVVHCDLKPANILVDEVGQPRVLDFGIARIIAAREGTETDGDPPPTGVRGTPRYMCPEQRDGKPAELNWDVYALGVIGATLIGIDPARPEGNMSGVGARAARELRAVLRRAYAEEGERRYRTAAGLHADLSRWLAHEPTQAFDGGRLHRLALLVRRRRALIGAIALVQLLLLAGIAGTSWQWRRAVKAGEALEHQVHKKQKIAEFLGEVLSMGTPERAHGREVTMREALDRSESLGPRILGDDPDVLALVDGMLGNAYQSLGLGEKAERHLRGSHDALVRELGSDAEETLVAQLDLGTVMADRGHHQEAIALIQDAMERSARRFGDSSALSLRCAHELGSVYLRAGDWSAAESQLEHALAGRELLLGPVHRDTLLTRGTIGVLRCEQKRLDEAEVLLRSTLEAMRAQLGPDHPQTLVTLNNLGTLYADQGRFEEALAIAQEEEAATRRISGEEHPETLVSRGNVAILVGLCGRLGESESLLRSLLEDCERLLPPDHPTLLQTRHYLCDILERAGKLPEAEEHGRLALEGRRRVLGATHEHTLLTANYLIKVLRREAKVAEVLEECERVLADIAASDHPLEPSRAAFFNDMANSQIELGMLEEAAQSVHEALASNPDGPDQDPELLKSSQRIEERLARLR